jgi:endoglucanase
MRVSAAALTIGIGIGSTACSTGPTASPTTNPVRPSERPTLEPRVDGNRLVDQNGRTLNMLGVNVNGTQDACIQGKGYAYGPAPSIKAQAIATWDADVVRVPLNEDCWLGINGAPSGFSATGYKEATSRWVHALNRAGMVVILDLYAAAPGSVEAIGEWPMADADHALTFWSQVSAAYAKDPSVIFDLFNEPMIGGLHPTTTDWACLLNGCETEFDTCKADPAHPCANVTYMTAGMQQLVDAVRSSGASQPIMVGGLNWAGDPCGVNDAGGNGGRCKWQEFEPTDPKGQLIVSFHTFDWTACNTPACWNVDVGRIASVVPVVTGEFGETDCSTSYVDAYMAWGDRHHVSYLATSWEPPSPTDPSQCVSESSGEQGQQTNGSGINLRLLSNWGGTPNTIAPEGRAVHSHFASLAKSE